MSFYSEMGQKKWTIYKLELLTLGLESSDSVPPSPAPAVSSSATQAGAARHHTRAPLTHKGLFSPASCGGRSLFLHL